MYSRHIHWINWLCHQDDLAYGWLDCDDEVLFEAHFFFFFNFFLQTLITMENQGVDWELWNSQILMVSKYDRNYKMSHLGLKPKVCAKKSKNLRLIWQIIPPCIYYHTSTKLYPKILIFLRLFKMPKTTKKGILNFKNL